MALDSFRRFMAPDFQAQQGPALDWMPWQEDATTENVGNIVGQLKQPKVQMGTKGGAMPSVEGKANPAGGKSSL